MIRFALLIARSHLRSRHASAGVNLLATVSTMGVAIGVTALIIVIAVTEGFEIDLRKKILGANAHIYTVHQDGAFSDWEAAVAKVEAVPGVVAAAPFVYGEVMLRSHAGSAGVILKGVDPVRTPRVTALVQNLKLGPAGELDDDVERQAVLDTLRLPPRGIAQAADDTEPLPGIILGTELAGNLGVFPGDRLHVINPVGGGVGPFGVPVPKVQPFRVAGVFYSGMYEFDTKWSYIAIPDAQAFLGYADKVTGIEIIAEDADAVGALSPQVDKALGSAFFSRNWKVMNKALFSALRLEKYVMGLILSLITAVASLNIVGSLILIVVTRSKEISILRALGASVGSVRLIFMLEGLLIGVVGTALGTALGLAGCWGLQTYPFPIDTDVYYLDKLPCVVVPQTVVTVALSAVAMCLLATLWPAKLAAEIQPADGLRYE
jgi:lipoprotein-releasing system permease protein